MKKTSLVEAVSALRTELAASIAAGADEALQFEVGEILLELQVEMEKSYDGDGKVSFWVVEIGGKSSQKISTIHTVSIPLKPVKGDGGPILTGDKPDILPE